MKRLVYALLLSSSLVQALEQPKNLGTYGALYEIKEKDWFVELKNKFDKFQKDVNITKQLESIVEKRMSVDLATPTCKENYNYQNELIITYDKDVIFQGAVIYKKGDRVKLLKKMPLDGYIVVTNVYTEVEKEMLYKIIAENKDRLRIYITKGNIKEIQIEIIKRFPNRNNLIIGAAPKAILERLDIRCVPTVAYQKDYTMILNAIELEENDEK